MRTGADLDPARQLPGPLTSVRQYTCEEYTERLPNPSLLAVLALDPLPGAGVFQLPMGVVMSIIDRLLGGPGGLSQPNRPSATSRPASSARCCSASPTSSPTRSTRSLPVHPLVGSVEFDPQFLQMAAPSEPVIVSDFAIRVGDQVATCTLCLPFATLQPALDALTDSQAPYRLTADSRTAVASSSRCTPCRSRSASRSARSRVTSSELLALAVGDVLPLRHPVAQPLAVVADGVQVASAVPGSHGPRLACQVVSV